MSNDMDEKTMQASGSGDDMRVPIMWSEDAGTSPVHGHIRDKLQEIYAEVVSQPIPDRLLQLLSKLESGLGGSGESK